MSCCTCHFSNPSVWNIQYPMAPYWEGSVFWIPPPCKAHLLGASQSCLLFCCNRIPASDFYILYTAFPGDMLEREVQLSLLWDFPHKDLGLYFLPTQAQGSYDNRGHCAEPAWPSAAFYSTPPPRETNTLWPTLGRVYSAFPRRSGSRRLIRSLYLTLCQNPDS